jgi:hypothetical protein
MKGGFVTCVLHETVKLENIEFAVNAPRLKKVRAKRDRRVDWVIKM